MDTLSDTLTPRAYSVRNFCKVYGLSRSTTYNLIASGKLRSVKVGSRTLIPADEAEKLLQSEAA